MIDDVRAIEWQGDVLLLLDQRQLPKKTIYLEIDSVDAAIASIKALVVRGAPAIGITAAYAVVLAARSRYRESAERWRELIREDLIKLAAARPTAVNLSWALQRMQGIIDAVDGDPVPPLFGEARQIHENDIKANQTMGDYGADLIKNPGPVLTHCNTGSLATGGYGTALGVIRSAYVQRRVTAVFATETRPWLQGSRLTAWELQRDGIPVSLITDSAAAWLMQQKPIEWVIVGADRIAANGDVANKIGTYNLAVVARQHGVNFMVVAPTSTIDRDISSGEQIPVEERAETEILGTAGYAEGVVDIGAWNPVFDVTPASLIDAIVTENGVVLEPTRDRIERLFTK
jgi:methylthioribose-1-phosphate isomerase